MPYENLLELLPTLELESEAGCGKLEVELELELEANYGLQQEPPLKLGFAKERDAKFVSALLLALEPESV